MEEFEGELEIIRQELSRLCDHVGHDFQSFTSISEPGESIIDDACQTFLFPNWPK